MKRLLKALSKFSVAFYIFEMADIEIDQLKYIIVTLVK